MKKFTFILLLFLQLNLISNIVYSITIFDSYYSTSSNVTNPNYKTTLPKWWNN